MKMMCPFCGKTAIEAGGFHTCVCILQTSKDDLVTVGDLNSQERGTGARKSAGKPDWSQFPLWTIAEIIELYGHAENDVSDRMLGFEMGRIDITLGQWQRGDDSALERAAVATLRAMITHEQAKDLYAAFALVVRVLEFGEKKYKKGNWAKGTKWSVCFTCAVSHYMKYLAGRWTDEESGISTLAHLLCNLLFLIAYRDLYPEGDDRMVEFKEGDTAFVGIDLGRPGGDRSVATEFETVSKGIKSLHSAIKDHDAGTFSYTHGPDCGRCFALGTRITKDRT